MRSARIKLLPALISLAVAGAFVGALVGQRVGRTAWEATRPGWLSIGSPPSSPARIAGIALPEFAIESPPTVYVQTTDGQFWFYDTSAGSSGSWRATTVDAAPPMGSWLDAPCHLEQFAFIPPLAGTIFDCAEYLPEAFQENPEAYIQRYALPGDGTVWFWARPNQLLSPVSVYTGWGLLAGLALGLIFLVWFLLKRDDNSA